MDVDALEYRPLARTSQDLQLYRECFANNGSERSVAMSEWQFLQPPPNKLCVEVAVANARDDAYLAAFYAAFPIWMKIGDQRRIGVQSIDTLTDSRFRGKGLFVQLAQRLGNRCADEGVGLIYGFPNGNSVKGFFKNLRWQSLDPVPHMFKPLRTNYLLRKARVPDFLAKLLDIPLTIARKPKLRGTERIVTVSAFDDAFTSLWERFSRNIPVAVIRDAAYLTWRTRKPSETYQTIALYDGDSLRGYAIIGINERSATRVGKIMELVHDPGDERCGQVLLQESVRELYRQGAEAAWACAFEHSPTHTMYRSAGFIRAPERFRPTETHMGVLALDPALNATLYDRSNWYISLLDSDTH